VIRPLSYFAPDVDGAELMSRIESRMRRAISGVAEH
jgi:hypothetical protein